MGRLYSHIWQFVQRLYPLVGWGLSYGQTVEGELKHKYSGRLRITLARRIDDLMRAKPGVDTQMALARRSGVGQSTIGRILRAETAATIDNVEALAGALGVAPAQLLHDSGLSGVSESVPPEFAHLPQAERERIAAFIHFTIEDYASKHRLAIDERKEAPKGAQARMQRAAKRANNENTNDSRYTVPERRPRGRPPKAARGR